MGGRVRIWEEMKEGKPLPESIVWEPYLNIMKSYGAINLSFSDNMEALGKLSQFSGPCCTRPEISMHSLVLITTQFVEDTIVIFYLCRG